MRHLLFIIAIGLSVKGFGQNDSTVATFGSMGQTVDPLSVTRLRIANDVDLGRIDELSKFKNLEYLSLRGDRLRSLPPQLFELERLKVLDLSDNDLDLLPEEFTNLRSLEELYLDQALKLDFDQALAVLGGLPNLKVLSMKNDSLLVIPESIADLNRLETLDLGGNKFTELPSGLLKLRNLKELYLDRESGLDFRSAFILLGKLPSLRILHLESNGLKVLPETINDIHSLEVLYLNGNQLSMVDLKRNRLQQLMLVDLEHNHVPAETLEHLERTGVRIRF